MTWEVEPPAVAANRLENNRENSIPEPERGLITSLMTPSIKSWTPPAKQNLLQA